MEDFCKLHTIFKVRANQWDLFEACLINCWGGTNIYMQVNETNMWFMFKHVTNVSLFNS